jgi:hypothetical protein
VKAAWDETINVCETTADALSKPSEPGDKNKAAAPEGAAAVGNHLVGCFNGLPVDWPLSAQPSGTVLRH